MTKDRKAKSKSKKNKYGKLDKKSDKKHHKKNKPKEKIKKTKQLKPPKIIIDKPTGVLPADKVTHYAPLPIELKRKMKDGKSQELIALSKDQVKLLAQTGKVAAKRRPGRPRMYAPGEAPSERRKKDQHALDKKAYTATAREEERAIYADKLQKKETAAPNELLKLLMKIRAEFDAGGLSKEQKIEKLQEIEDKVARASVDELAGDNYTSSQQIRQIWTYILTHIKKTGDRFGRLGIASETPTAAQPPPQPAALPPLPESTAPQPSEAPPRSITQRVLSFIPGMRSAPYPPVSAPISPPIAPSIDSAVVPQNPTIFERNDNIVDVNNDLSESDFFDDGTNDVQLLTQPQIEVIGATRSSIQDRPMPSSSSSSSHVVVSAHEPIPRSAQNPQQDAESSSESDEEPAPPPLIKGKQKQRERHTIHSFVMPTTDEEEDKLSPDNFVDRFTSKYPSMTPAFRTNSYTILKRANALNLFDTNLSERYNKIQDWFRNGKKGDIATANSQRAPDTYIQTTLNQLMTRAKKLKTDVTPLMHTSTRTQHRRNKK